MGRETPQERLRNGWRNGRFLAKVTANASPRGDQQSWEVALPSDEASRRSSPARDKGPPRPFPPTLYPKYLAEPLVRRCTFPILCHTDEYSFDKKSFFMCIFVCTIRVYTVVYNFFINQIKSRTHNVYILYNIYGITPYFRKSKTPSETTL